MTKKDSNFISNNTYINNDSNNDIKNKKLNTHNLNPWSADNELTSTQQLQKIARMISESKVEGAAEATTLELEGLKNAYRALHGQHIERQIELEASRTDRDSLMVELKCTKDSLATYETDDRIDSWNDHPGSRSVAANSDLREALESGEREMAELRAMIARKETALDRILGDLSEEKHARGTLEQATHTLSTHTPLTHTLLPIPP
jgi:hypothetical protein